MKTNTSPRSNPKYKRNPIFTNGPQVNSFKELSQRPFNKLIVKLCKTYELLYETDPKDLIDSYIKMACIEELHKGTLETAKLMKAIHSLSIRYAVGHDFNRLPFRKADPEGYPKIVKQFKVPLRGDIKEVRTALSVLELYKLVKIDNEEVSFDSILGGDPNLQRSNPSPDNQSYLFRIHDNYNGPNKELIKSIAIAWNKEVKLAFPRSKVQERLKIIGELTSLHVTARNGPNGPAMITVLQDYVALKRHGLWDRIKEWSTNLGVDALLGRIEEIIPEGAVEAFSKYNLSSARVSVKQEPGGKNRLFATGDYFTQTVMSGLHRYMFSVLKSFPEDGTFDQNRIGSIAQEWTKNIEEHCSSTDLTTATDRIPCEMEAEIISALMGRDFARLWLSIMTDRDFQFNGKEERQVRYNKGQPMGFLSSWASLAMWHHIILKTIYRVLKIKYKGNNSYVEYLILGDDNAKVRKDVSDLYNFILELIDVPSSIKKGFTNETLIERDLKAYPNNNCVEIAKRVFRGGVEVTTISPDLILNSLMYTQSFTSLLIAISNKGIYVNQKNIAYSLSRLCYKPSESFLLATFPLCPAPFSGLTEYRVGGVDEYVQGTPWFNGSKTIEPSKMALIDEAAIQYLQQQVGNSLAEFFVKVSNLANFKEIECIRKGKTLPLHLEITKRYRGDLATIVSDFNQKFLFIIAEKYALRVHSESLISKELSLIEQQYTPDYWMELGITSLVNSYYSLGFKTALRENITKTQDLLELNYLINPYKQDRFRDKKTRTDRIVRDVIKHTNVQVNQLNCP